MDELTPAALGKLIALCTNTSVFTQGIIWNIDSFDQWGVELGQRSSPQNIIPELDPARPNAPLKHDSSTNALIRRYRAIKRRARKCNSG